MIPRGQPGQARMGSPRSAQEARYSVLCAVGNVRRCTGCRAMPAKPEGCWGALQSSGVAVPNGQHCTAPKDRWLILAHSSHQADSPRTYFVTLALTAESGRPARVRPTQRGDFDVVCSIDRSI